MRRGSIVQLVLIGALVGGAVTVVALVIPWLPPSASKERGGIDFVFWFTTGICIAVFALVAAVIIYAVTHFRAAPDDDSDGLPIHGHTGLEIVWTAIPAVLVTAISVASAAVLHRNDHIPKRHLTVEVVGQQFAWSFKYDDEGGLTAGMLRLPVDEPVLLKISALDVIHSFWVPEFGQKLDALPGSVNNLVITPNKVGRYPVICTELCGLGHAVMRTSAIVMTRGGFNAWVRAQRKALNGPQSGAGKAVFANQGCNSCHTLKAAAATAKVGPDLDKLPAEAKLAGKPLEGFVRESIVDPNAYVEPGFHPNVMPEVYKQLPKDQLDALVKFLVESSKGS